MTANVEQYGRYYLDRRHQRPLPVILARVNDEGESRYYSDPRTARIVGSHNACNWFSRWVYHAMHSFDFPWLYNYRPARDIVVAHPGVAGARRTVGRLFAGGAVNQTTLGGDDLVIGVK